VLFAAIRERKILETRNEELRKLAAKE